MKKFISLFVFLAVVGYGCQDQNEGAMLDAAAKATAGDAAVTSGYIPAAGTTVNCVDIYDLTAGQNIKAGTVEVSNDAAFIYVTYKTMDGWYLTETHTYAGGCEYIPTNGAGIPVPGQFPDNSGDITGETTYTAKFAYSGSDYCLGCILAHAAVAKQTGEVTQTETAWGGDQIGTSSRWYYHISNYCVRECEPEDLHLRTQTIGGWGAPANGSNPGAYLHANWNELQTNGAFVVGNGKKITFTSAAAITNYLPDGGSAKALASSVTNPSSLKNVFASQVVALKISVTFDGKIEEFSVSNFNLADAKVATGPFEGKTVAEVLMMAEKVLGGTSIAPETYTIAQLNEVVSKINESFVDGKISEKSAFLRK